MADNEEEWKPTDKQQKFVDSYEGNATKAAIEAGYSEKTARAQGQRLLTNVYIMQEIEKRREKERTEKIASRQEREEILSNIARNTRGVTELDRQTLNEKINVEVESRDQIKAIDVLNKMDLVYIQKHEVTGPGGGPVKTENTTITAEMSEKEAAALYARMVKNGE